MSASSDVCKDGWCKRMRPSCVALLVLALTTPMVVVAAPATPTIQGDAQAVAEYTAAFQKFAAARTYRSRLGSAQGAITIEVVRPDRMRFTMQAGQFVRIAMSMWSIESGKCSKIPAAIRMPNPDEIAQQDSDSTIQVARIGAETVEGAPTQVYNVVVTAKGKTIEQKVHVATQTGYPRRIESTTAEGNAVIDFWDFNAAIAIEPPC